MSLVFLIATLFVLLYMGVQTVSDIKTKTVYIGLNYLAIGAMLTAYICKCIFSNLPIRFGAIIGMFFFLAIHFFFFQRFLGTGDAKALVVFALQSGLMFGNSSEFNLFFPIFIYFLANILFSIVVIVDGVKQKRKAKDIFLGKGKRAFFPFLLPAYILSVGFWMLSY